MIGGGTGYGSAASDRIGAEQTNNPGELDNRMSISVGSFPVIEQWEDGKLYRLDVLVRQVSPGEFEVVKMPKAVEAEPGDENVEDDKGAAGDETEGQPNSGTPSAAANMDQSANTSSNPAVNRRIAAMGQGSGGSY